MVGQYNSSITRVRPFFQALLTKDPTGQTWLPKLLGITPLNAALVSSMCLASTSILPKFVTTRSQSDPVLKKYGIPLVRLEECFEYLLPPPVAFLRWTIYNFDQLSWPDDGHAEFRKETMDFRLALRGDVGPIKQREVVAKAIAELDKWSSRDSMRKWWAFEGFTHTDCYIETDTFILLIEGKRTEPLSSSTNWYPDRNQMVRNLEVLKERAGDKEFAAVLMAEDHYDPITPEVFEVSLPHFTPEERNELMGHYLGCVTWKQACEVTGLDFTNLPNTTQDVVDKLK